MKIELKIDYDADPLRGEGWKSHTPNQTPIKYDTAPRIFYYTNCLNFETDGKEGGFDCVKFFESALGRNVMFNDKEINLSENLTNMCEVQGFFNRFDLYHIAWEITNQTLFDSTQKQKIIEYLTQNCCFKIYAGEKIITHPFTDLNNKLYINTGLFTRIEAQENFIIKLKKTGLEPSNYTLKLLPDVMLKIYLHGNYWMEKRN